MTTRRERRQNRNQPGQPIQEESKLTDERREPTIMTTQKTPVTEMTEEERNAAFEKWFASQQNKTVNNQAKRKAAATLKSRHESEYNQILDQEKARLMGG